ncbi:MAG TPA: Gfo/Idh/MocA family oxidoreductase [Planctomycetota bacterium]|nr:Gfo/Idh/MocA family oxidoreductase [Planctomycetota bacterium]
MMKYALVLALLFANAEDEPIRIGIVGLDTSHVVAFTQLLNDSKHANYIPGAKVVCAFKGGSPDVESSSSRIDGFTKTLQEKWGVEIVDSVEALCAKVDAVLLESVDGRPHLAQARPIFAAKKRVFIDKPLAGSYKDGVEIARLAKESGTPFFSASAVRFYDAITKTKEDPAIGKVQGCDAFSPASLEPHHPDLFWYGVHGVEALYTIMGPGCESVRRSFDKDTDLVVGRWKDGRTATYRGIRKGKADYGVTIFGEKAVRSSLSVQAKNDYHNLVVEIVKFFKTGTPPVSVEEMLEVLAFMEAADVSKAKNGAEVRLDELK